MRRSTSQKYLRGVKGGGVAYIWQHPHPWSLLTFFFCTVQHGLTQIWPPSSSEPRRAGVRALGDASGAYMHAAAIHPPLCCDTCTKPSGRAGNRYTASWQSIQPGRAFGSPPIPPFPSPSFFFSPFPSPLLPSPTTTTAPAHLHRPHQDQIAVHFARRQAFFFSSATQEQHSPTLTCSTHIKSWHQPTSARMPTP